LLDETDNMTAMQIEAVFTGVRTSNVRNQNSAVIRTATRKSAEISAIEGGSRS
jgi:hypothetical protein